MKVDGVFCCWIGDLDLSSLDIGWLICEFWVLVIWFKTEKPVDVEFGFLVFGSSN